jgi:hypothetical protein
MWLRSVSLRNAYAAPSTDIPYPQRPRRERENRTGKREQESNETHGLRALIGFSFQLTIPRSPFPKEGGAAI